MTSQTDLLRFGLAALLTGVAIPLAVQLFLVLRNVQKATATIDRRLDQTLRDVGDVIAELKRVSVPAPSLTSQLAAALPAVIAAVHAFRSGMNRPDSSDAPSSNHHAKENAVPEALRKATEAPRDAFDEALRANDDASAA
jgi:hypothetical protein